MSRMTKKAFTMNTVVTVKAVDKKTAVALLDIMLTRRGFASVINEKNITESEVESKAKAKKEAKKDSKKDAKPSTKEVKKVSIGMGLDD